MKCNYTYRHYEEIIEVAKREGFQFSSFLERPDNQKRIYMRHDIDISIGNALAIAEIEKNNQVKSSFFIQLNSYFYNIFEDDNLQIIRRITSLGHYLGIHFDMEAILYKTEVKLEEQIRWQYDLLQEFFPLQKVVSFHHPSSKVLNNEIDCGDFVSTYSPEFQQMYVSDSNGRWKGDCPCKLLKDANFKNIQILVHPFWWNEEESWGFKDLYQRFSKSREDKLHRDFKASCKIYREIL